MELLWGTSQLLAGSRQHGRKTNKEWFWQRPGVMICLPSSLRQWVLPTLSEVRGSNVGRKDTDRARATALPTDHTVGKHGHIISIFDISPPHLGSLQSLQLTSKLDTRSPSSIMRFQAFKALADRLQTAELKRVSTAHPKWKLAAHGSKRAKDVPPRLPVTKDARLVTSKHLP